jgi:hypothetical protein
MISNRGTKVPLEPLLPTIKIFLLMFGSTFSKVDFKRWIPKLFRLFHEQQSTL